MAQRGAAGAMSSDACTEYAPTEFRAWCASAKLNMANERTLLSWVRLSATLAAGGFFTKLLHHGQSASAPVAAGAVQLVASGLLVFMGIALFLWRANLLANRHRGSYSSRCGSLLAVGTIGAALATALRSLVAIEMHVHSDACARLDLPLLDFAPPPFLYISFHGASNPLRAPCADGRGVNGIHRFTLGGGYAGPATDEREISLRFARGMALVPVGDDASDKNLLCVAEAWAQARSDPTVTIWQPRSRARRDDVVRF